MTNPVFYSPEEVARLLKVSPRSVRRWIHKGALRARRFGRQLRIPSEALEENGEWLALATSSWAKDWENEKDAEYDRWKEHYGVPKR